jgi:hypothetical protein
MFSIDGTSAVLSVVFPILVALPFASSYVVDVDSGMIDYIYLRMGRIKYLLTRLLVNALVSGFVISSSLLISFILFLMIKNFDVQPINSVSVVLFKEIFNESPVVYILIYILNTFICGAVFSTFGLGLSTIIKKQYFAVLSPFLLYILSGTLFTQINKFFNSAILFDLNYYGDLKIIHVLFYDIFLLILSISIFLIGALKDGK